MYRIPTRKGMALLGAAVCAVALAACGDANERVTSGTYAGEGGVPAPYLQVGQLAYQVQISRELNPYESEDQAYLEGIPPALQQLKPGEEWFAVFLQVYNETGKPHPASTEISLFDTQDNVYYPINPTGYNPFVYRGGEVPAHGRLPEPNSIAGESPTQGAALLFKIKLASLANRPIEIKIVNPENPKEVATAELDV